MKTFSFSDFVEINPTISLRGKGTFSFVEMKDLNDGQRFVYPSQDRVLAGGARFGEGDTLFARITPCLENGKICQAKGLKNSVGFGSTEFLVFRERKGISDKDFIYYLSRWDEVRRYAELNLVGTSGRQRVPKDVFDKLKLTLPDLKTQKRVAEILSAFDGKIELNHRMNQTLEQMAQTLFQQYFVNNGDEENLPEGWKIGKIREIGSVNLNTLSKQDKLEWLDYVEISAVGRGKINNTEHYKRGEEPSRARRKLKHGDTVLSTVRPDRGAYFLAINPSANLIASTGFAVFSATTVPFSFLYLLLTQEEFFKYYGFIANGAAYPAINPESIFSMEIVIPPTEVLNNFHSKVEPLFLKYNINNQESKSLSNLRDTLLPKLMSGEIDVMQTKAEELYEPVLS